MSKFISLLSKNRQSGFAVSIISIPLSISLAVASGATPLQGIITAIWAGAIAASFGGSQYNIVGPTGALSGLILSFGLLYGYQALPLLAIVVGLWTLLVWLLKMTRYITLIPSTALHGFIVGVALIITSGQLPGALGLTGLPKAESVIDGFVITLSHIEGINRYAFVLFVVTLSALLIWKRLIKSVPGILPISVIGILIGYLSSNGYIAYPIVTLAQDMAARQFPELMFQLVDLSLFAVRLPRLTDVSFVSSLLIAGFTIGIVAILETIISAKIADKMTKTKFNQEKEVLGLGLANIAVGAVGGIPATAALIRTALNVKSGSTSRVSAVISSVCIAVISWLLFEYFQYIPVPVISAILINIAIGMLDIKTYKKVYYYDPKSFWILMTVGIITFVEDPMIGIAFGTGLSLLLYLRHASQGKVYGTLFRDRHFDSKMTLEDYVHHQQVDDVFICKFSGEINFVCISAEIEQLVKVHKHVTIILSFSNISYIDIDGLETFEEVIELFDDQGFRYYFSGVEGRLLKIMKKTDFFQCLEREGKVFPASSEVLKHLGIGTKQD